jgi:hypothetical protein
MHKILMTTTAAILLAASPAAADCTPRDLEGRWALFAHGESFVDGTFPFLLGCRVILNQAARLTRDSACLGGALRGQLEVTKGCTIQGVIELREISVDCGISAAVTPDHDVVSGIAACDNGDGFLFNLIRR